MDYSTKLITIQEALAKVKSGDQIVTGLGSAEAHEFMLNLHTIADRVNNVTVTNCLPMCDAPFIREEFRESFYVDGWFYSPALRKVHKNGNIAYIPNHLHLAGSKRLFHVHPNLFIGACSMPDKHGYVSLSLSNTYEKQTIAQADLVIMEINPNMPYTYGDVELHMNEIDFMIQTDYEVPVLAEVESNEKDEKIGKAIASYINDGDCIQLGIGGIPNAVAAHLHDKKDLGVHTEMLTTGLMRLAKMGVITGAKKTLHKGKMVATFALGTSELYEYLDHNPGIMILDGGYVNDPAIIGLNDNQISINTTMEIDLSGQCCSESIGSMQFSGAGGQADTAVGAQNSKNGKSFIALYSTAMAKNPLTGEREEVSKIVPQLKPGAAVTLSRNDVDFVVTEYGVVSLRGTSIRERVSLLIGIAHPKYREELMKQAKELGILA